MSIFEKNSCESIPEAKKPPTSKIKFYEQKILDQEQWLYSDLKHR